MDLEMMLALESEEVKVGGPIPDEKVTKGVHIGLCKKCPKL
jgi:hypothetical protein